jgi:medium-chain acyl-[acyl-carrier-protein] hydrolase
MQQPRDAWVTFPRPNPYAAIRLFCFTYAGGGTAVFSNWAEFLPLNVEVCPIRLPGRESRLQERPYTRIDEIVPPLVEAILPFLDKPFVFYGHSMGAIVAFETARQLRSLNQPEPKQLLVSGCRAPQVPDSDRPIHSLPEAEFVAAMSRLNGTPKAVLVDKDILALLMPLLRADFEAIETYKCLPEKPLACSISIVGAEDDPKADCVNMEAWQDQTCGCFSHHVVPGNHFFIRDEPFRLWLADQIRQL